MLRLRSIVIVPILIHFGILEASCMVVCGTSKVFLRFLLLDLQAKLSQSWKNLREVKVANRGNSQSLWNNMCVTFKSLSSTFLNFFLHLPCFTIFTFHLDTGTVNFRTRNFHQIWVASSLVPAVKRRSISAVWPRANWSILKVKQPSCLGKWRWGEDLCKFLPKFVWGEKIYLGSRILMMFCWWGI